MDLADDIKSYLRQTYENIIDKDHNYYKNKSLNVLETRMGMKVASIEPAKEDYNLETKGVEYDPYLESFIAGSGGQLSSFNIEKNKKNTRVIRGLGTNSQRALKHCMENNIDFYAIDTGYMQPDYRKLYHRVTKNALQNLGPIVERPKDRLKKLNWTYREPAPGKKILVCPPSEKVMKFYNLDLNKWMQETIDEIKTYTQRPIEIRLKPGRAERVTTDTIWQALEDAYCLVTFNSIAATEALLYSVPAIALAPNAASVLSNTSLKDIVSPYLPTKHEVINFAAHLSYCQFTNIEMQKGLAWKILNESS